MAATAAQAVAVKGAWRCRRAEPRPAEGRRGVGAHGGGGGDVGVADRQEEPFLGGRLAVGPRRSRPVPRNLVAPVQVI